MMNIESPGVCSRKSTSPRGSVTHSTSSSRADSTPGSVAPVASLRTRVSASLDGLNCLVFAHCTRCSRRLRSAFASAAARAAVACGAAVSGRAARSRSAVTRRATIASRAAVASRPRIASDAAVASSSACAGVTARPPASTLARSPCARSAAARVAARAAARAARAALPGARPAVSTGIASTGSASTGSASTGSASTGSASTGTTRARARPPCPGASGAALPRRARAPAASAPLPGSGRASAARLARRARSARLRLAPFPAATSDVTARAGGAARLARVQRLGARPAISETLRLQRLAAAVRAARLHHHAMAVLADPRAPDAPSGA
jgi:hypothetical protein